MISSKNLVRNEHDKNCKRAAWALRDHTYYGGKDTVGLPMNLYEMDKAEILMEFFQKLNLEQLQELRDIVFQNPGMLLLVKQQIQMKNQLKNTKNERNR